MERPVDSFGNANDVEDVENVKSNGIANIESSSLTDRMSSSTNVQSCEKLQKTQLFNTSFDDSPFVNLRGSKLRKKKTQSKLTYLKLPGTTSKKNTNGILSKSCDGENVSQKLKDIDVTSSLEASTGCNSEVSVSDDNDKLQNSVLVCPVCWKKFETAGSQLAHMKLCATKHNLTLKQLLDALDLQTKQIEERRVLGLPSVPTTAIAKKSTSKRTSSINDGSDPDLQLGLALSVSMKESEEQNQLAEQEILMEAGLGDEVAANQASLLERFGFTSTRPVLPSMHSRSRPGKPKLKGTPLLLLRSQEERERLITEKVAIMLTSEDANKSLSHENDLISPGFQLKSEVLSQLENKGDSLWKKASASPCSKDCEVYYIEPLSHVITPSKITAGSKLKHLSQVPCRLKTPVRHSPTSAENFSDYLPQREGDEHDLQNIEGIDVSRCENVYENTDVIPVITDAETKDNLCTFVHELAISWKTLLSSGNRSDLRIRVKDGLEISVHELVLFVRCPNVLLDVIQEINDTNACMKYIIWNEVSFKCALAFLDFIYCGSTYKINEVTDDLDEIKFLSRKYDVKELCNYLNCAEISDEVPLQHPCQKSDKSLGFFEAKEGRTEHSKLCSAQKGSTASVYQSSAKNSKHWNSSPSKNEENIVATCIRNTDDKEVSECISSAKRNDLPDKSCPSPDPFGDSDQEMNSIHFSKKNSSPNTQHNMDYLLKALDKDKISESNSSKELVENSETCSPSPTVRKHNEQNIAITEKRKLANASDVSDMKLICMSNRKSARKSLLSRFSGEHDNITENEKIMKHNMSQSSSENDSVIVIESMETNSEKSNHSLHEDECNKVLIQKKEVNGDNLSSYGTDELTSGSKESPIYCSEGKLNDSVNGEDEMYMNALGDFCADYEYQNFHANCSPYGQISSEIKCCKNESERKKFSMIGDTENTEVYKSPFSSPVNVKTSSPGRSPVSSRKKVHSTTKQVLRKVRSSSDISVNNDSCPSSPISVKCLSQTSIHLKTSLETSAEKNERRTVVLGDTESNMEVGISSGIALGTPVTPNCQLPKTPNRSIKSLKRLLEDSFTDEMIRNHCFSVGDIGTMPCSTPVATASRLSVKKFKDMLHEENCLTPIADYSVMDTPGLKKELQKYGLKPLKRKRAKQILRHIYDELHPLVPAQTSGDEVLIRKSVQNVPPLACSMKQSQEELVKNRSTKMKHTSQKVDMSTTKLTGENDISSENDSFPSTQESSSSSQCEYEVQNDMTEDCALTQTDISELPAIVRNYITNNPVLHQQVLLFEPIWLEQLQDALKAQNYKFKLDNLMEYLDEECITFRVAQGTKAKRGRRKEKSSK